MADMPICLVQDKKNVLDRLQRLRRVSKDFEQFNAQDTTIFVGFKSRFTCARYMKLDFLRQRFGFVNVGIGLGHCLGHGLGRPKRESQDGRPI